jgi:hypothetical protein
MTKTQSFAGSTLTLLLVCTLAPTSMAAELAPHVLAQVEERGGFRVVRTPFTVRIFDDGRIEALETEKWTEIGRLSEAAVRRFKRVTDVITASNRFVVQDTKLADAPTLEYSVRNKNGEVVLIAKRGAQDGALLQGGVTSIVELLDGLMELARISY